ncbi:SMC5-SMC6 complex localization factor protein 1 [Octopus bimaculoides]|nr:SMC5-SMC6 complex localization factor protein 1 [Octopus bimaculoides]XP_014783672.1 SMC5-SMC6 complex localization factor protein 1 [Octopus bimaculoides]|eukprot:XP_014783671.1 PREDICTED: SMC5-SMC6 complex localization factor protein 1-like [Octopus bimaculoides]
MIRMNFPVILLSNFSESETARLASLVQQLKGECLVMEVFNRKCTHLVCKRLSCSEEFLIGCARGVWILTPDFIYDSAKNGMWVQEYNYEWGPHQAEPRDSNQMHMCEAPSRWRKLIQQNKGLAFNNWKVAVLVKSNRRRIIYQRILSYGGATLYMIKLPIKNSGDVADRVNYVFVDSRHWDHVKPLRKTSINCLHVTYIRDYLIDDSLPDTSNYIQCKGLKRKISVGLKRKVPLNFTIESALASQKYLRLSQQSNSWETLYKSIGGGGGGGGGGDCVNEQQQQQPKITDTVPPMVMHRSLVEMINCCLQEEYAIHGGLSMALDFVSAGSYLPPEICYYLMKDILLRNRSSLLNNLCYEVLMKQLSLFPPGVSWRHMYLQALQEGEKQEHYQNEWGFVKETVLSSLQLPLSDASNCSSHGSFLLLKYLDTVFQQDFNDSLKSSKHNGKAEGSKTSFCLIRSIIWGSSYGLSINKSCLELKDLLRKVIVTDLPEVYRKEVLSLVLSLILMVAESLRQAYHCCDSIKDYFAIVQQETNLNIFIHEVSKEIYYGCQDDLSKFDQVLNAIRLPWLALSISYILTKSFHDINDIPNTDGSDIINLTNLVNKYLSVLCQIKCRPSKRKTSHNVLAEESTNCQLTSENESNSQSPSRLSPVNKMFLTKRLARNVNKRNYKGETKLHIACMKNDVDQVRDLLTLPGIDVNATDNNGWTPLHEACNHNHPDCVTELLNFNRVRTINSYFSACYSQPQSTRVDVCATAEDLITPLHDAVLNESIACAQLLLKYKGPKLLQLKTIDGATPLDLATTEEMVAVLNTFLPDANNSINQSNHSDIIDVKTPCPNNSETVAKLTYSQIEKYSCFVFHLIRCYLNTAQLPYITWRAKAKQSRHEPSMSLSLCDSEASTDPCKCHQNDCSHSAVDADGSTGECQQTQCVSDAYLDVFIKDITTVYNIYKIELKLKEMLPKFPTHLKRLFLLFELIE